ncbi:MAG: AAA family ATPase [Alphaproteobacteria bacterium]|nr:AAA family ATPase [Alphaproteobacteria bacterium]
MKGIADPVEAYVVVGEAASESRFDARRSGTLADIVGREQELEFMRERWSKAMTACGQMVLVSGEAGIGKSRITRAVIDEIAQDDHNRMTFQCSPYHTDSAFYPIIQQLTFAAGILPADGNQERLEKLEGIVGTDPEYTALMAMLLGIDASRRYDPLDMSPAQIRARTMQALVRQLAQQAEEKPLLAIFEDLHWVDPTTLELLDLSLDVIADKKILILATARPTFEHGFGGHPIVTRFALNRLGREQILSIVNKLTGGKSLPAEVMEIITGRTDGVPLFVEELTKTILESDVLKVEGDKLFLDRPLDTLAIPSTLHDSLMARLDRLQPIKEVAQTAACIGREFEHQLLAAISPLTEADLNTALDGLIRAELVYRRGVPPEAIYLFKHALVRDAAYESLLKERRRNIHSEILRALEKHLDIAPEVRAHHAEAAGQTERAIDLWEVASKAAIARPAYDEGISHLKHAIALISPQVNGNDRTALELALSLQVQLGIALLARAGYGADETISAFEYALALADKVGDTPMRYSVLYGLWAGLFLRAEYAEALSQAEALILLAETSTETAPLVVANRLAGLSLCLQGRFARAQTHFDRALSIYDPLQHTGLENQFGQDIGMSVHCYLALNLMACGETRRAEEHAQKSEEAALAISHANSILYMHLHLAVFALLSCDEVAVERHAEAMIPIAREHDLLLWLGYIAILQELLAVRRGDEAGIERYMKADTDFVAAKSKLFVSLLRIEAGWRALAIGLREPARKLAAMARQMIAETGETFALSNLCRLEGALELDAGNHQEAETILKEAIGVARDQGAKLWQLRAAIDLAGLWQTDGLTAEATKLLKPIHDSIADGDCPEDHAKAQAMLTDFKG